VDPEGWTIPSIAQDAWSLLKKITSTECFSDFSLAAEAYPGEVMLNKQYAHVIHDEPVGELVLRGAHIGRYEFNDEPKQGAPKYLDVDGYLKGKQEDTKAYHHKLWRIGFQRGAAIDNWRRLIGTLLKPGVFLTDTVGYIIAKDQHDLHFLLSLFNCSLFEWYFGLRSSTNHVNAYEVDSLPLRCIHFTTPKSERSQLFADLVSEYEGDQDTALLVTVGSLLPQDTNGSFVVFAPGATGAEEKSDVIHDLLAYLAQRMIALNEEKQAEQRRFLDWLEAALHVSPDSKGNSGLDVLTGKTIIRGYLGDYQKGEPETPWDEIEDVLFKNRRRLGVSLNEAGLLARLREEYAKSLDLLLPIKAQLARTDRLIDQVVYRLYGLTEEEIAVVEGRA
jgi:hypothetical protein